MIDFLNTRNMTIPEGLVTQIEIDGKVVWRYTPPYRNYVSLGDSIAAGHLINSQWKTTYGSSSQYGHNGNKQTAIVANSYTDLINKQLTASNPTEPTTATSFARSGITVADLMTYLTHDTVINAIENTDLVTVCIGANDILLVATDNISGYVLGDDAAKNTIINGIESGLRILNDDSNATSFTKLFEKLYSINPNATYVFTNIYNPFKEFHLDDGTNGFLEGYLDTIPDIFIFDIEEEIGFDIPLVNLRIDIGEFIRASIDGMPIVQQFYERINSISGLAEKYIDNWNGNDLNAILARKIEAFNTNKGIANFKYVDTKALFDTYTGSYTDLVNVRYTEDTDMSKDMNWSRLWAGKYSGWQEYWYTLAKHYIHINEKAFPSLNVNDYYRFDPNGLWNDALGQITEIIVKPDTDPHPREKGHELLKQAFVSAITA